MHFENRYLQYDIKEIQIVRTFLCMHTFFVKLTFPRVNFLNFCQIF